MQRTALGRVAAVGVLLLRGYRVDLSFAVVADALMGCERASPTPYVQFQALPRTRSSGKEGQSLSISKLTAVVVFPVAEMISVVRSHD